MSIEVSDRRPTKKELKTTRKIVRKQSEAELRRIRMAIIANKPRWLPRFVWVRIVAIVLDSTQGRARGK